MGSTAGFGLLPGDPNQAELPAELCSCTAASRNMAHPDLSTGC